MKQNPKTKFCTYTNFFVNKFLLLFIVLCVVKPITKKIFNGLKLF